MQGEILCKKVPANSLSYDADYVTENLNKRAESELNENEDTRLQSLRLLRSMLKEEMNLRWQEDDLFLLSFLRARKFDLKKAFRLIKGFYATLGKRRNFYHNFSFDDLRRAMESNCIYFLPHRDTDGSIVFACRYSAWDSDVFSLEELIVFVTIGFIQALRSPATQIAGFKFIVDFEGFSLKQLFQSRPSHLWFFSEILQNSFPLRARGFHIVNQNHLFHSILVIFKPFLSQKLRDRIHVHGKDMDDLHKFIDPSILPAEFNGEQPPFDNSVWRERMEASADYINHVLSFGYEKYLKSALGEKATGSK